MTQLRKQMLEELQRRNYSQTTVKGYLKIVESFAKHFHHAPDQLGPEQIRTYQVYLLNERKHGVRTVGHCTAALRFFSVRAMGPSMPPPPRQWTNILAHSRSAISMAMANPTSLSSLTWERPLLSCWVRAMGRSKPVRIFPQEACPARSQSPT